MTPQDLLHFFSRPIAFHRALARAGGGAIEGLFLSQCLYWQDRATDPDGFYKTGAEWEDETCLTRREQEGVRQRLRERGILIETKKGVPARIYYRIDLDVLYKTLIEQAQERAPKVPKNDTEGMHQTYKLNAPNVQTECTKRTNCMHENAKLNAPNVQTITENTNREYTESTSDTFAGAGASAAKPTPKRMVKETNPDIPTLLKEIENINGAPLVQYAAEAKHAQSLLKAFSLSEIITAYTQWRKKRSFGFSLASFAKDAPALIGEARRTVAATEHPQSALQQAILRNMAYIHEFEGKS